MTGLDQRGSFINDPDVSEKALGLHLQALAEMMPVLPGSAIDVEYSKVPTHFHKYLETVFSGSLSPRVNIRYLTNQYGIAETHGIEVSFLKKPETCGLLEVDKDLSLVSVATRDDFSPQYNDLRPQDLANFLSTIPDNLHALSVDTKSSMAIFSSLSNLLDKSLPISLKQQNKLAEFQTTAGIKERIHIEQRRVIGPKDIFTSIKLVDAVSQPNPTKDDRETTKEELELYFDQNGTTLALSLVKNEGQPNPQAIDHYRILSMMNRIERLQAMV